MAENTETYKVVIDTEVKGADNVELLNRTVKTSIGEFENLNEAIGKTQDTLGKIDPKSKEFKELSKELSGLKDRLKETEINSVRFTEALAAQPGVAGLVGQSLEGLRGTMKVFMANPIIAVITGIAGAFLAMKEALSRTEEGQAKLTKVSEGFTKVMNGLFAVLEPIANFFIDLVISLLENEKVMNALGIAVGVVSAAFQTLFNVGKGLVDIVINNLVTGFRTLIDVGSAAGKVIKGVFTLDLGLITEGLEGVKNAYVAGVKDVVNNVVEGGKNIANGVVDGIQSGFEAGAGAFKEGSKRLTEAEKEEEKKRNEEAKKRADERKKLADEAAKKKLEEEKKQLEEQKKLVDEANKILVQQYIKSLEARDAEVFVREQAFNEERNKLVAAGITDLTLLEENFRKDKIAINAKFDEEERVKEQERKDKIKEVQKAEFDEELLALDNELNLQSLSFDERRNLIAEKEALLLQQESLTQQQRIAIAQAASNERIAIDQAEIDAKLALELEYIQIVEDFGNLLQQVAGKSKGVAITGIIVTQAASIAKIIANTSASIATLAAGLPFTAPSILATKISAGIGIASTIASAAKAISTINSTPGGSAGGGGGVSAPPAAAIAIPSIGGISAPQVTGVEGGSNPASQIASTLAQTTDRPLRAFVVERDISSSQAMSRRTAKAASFG